MRALNRFSVAIVLAGTFAGAAAAQTADRPQPQAGASTAGPVTTVNQAVDRIIAREHDEVAAIRRYSPIVETYVQDMKPDAEMGIVPMKDQYFLGQAQLSSGITDDSMLDKKKKKKKGFAEEFNPFSHLEGSSSSIPDGFLKMVYVDPNDFDRAHYDFRYEGKEFLGEVRCVVFDVTPLPKSGKGRFNGRIWAEDQGFTIVRFNGMFQSTDNEGIGFNLHFDSWRMNLQPDVLAACTHLQPGIGTQDRLRLRHPFQGADSLVGLRPRQPRSPGGLQSAHGRAIRQSAGVAR